MADAEDVTTREQRAYAAALSILHANDPAEAEAALASLPLSSGDAGLIRMALGMDRRDTRAMMLGKAAVTFVEFGDAAAGVGIAQALLDFWTGEGQRDPRYEPLSRVEIGSVLVMQSGGLVRLGQADRAVTLVDAHPGLHDKRRYLTIRAAEGLARARRFDEARRMLPAERPEGDIAESTGWDVVANLLAGTDDGEEPTDAPPGRNLGSIGDRWNEALDALIRPLRAMAAGAGPLGPMGEMMAGRLEAERRNVPQSEADLIERINGLRDAMRKGLGIG